MPGSNDGAELSGARDKRAGTCCLLPTGGHGRSGWEVLRRSMAGLRVPLPTLHVRPHDHPRMTRGRCGTLLLHRKGLSPSVSRRSPDAPSQSPPADSRAAPEIVTTPSAGDGQMNRPRSSLLANRHMPWPSCQSTLIRPPRRPRKTKRCPPCGSSRRTSCTCSARPSKPLRMSVRPAASQTRVPDGGVITGAGAAPSPRRPPPTRPPDRPCP